MKRITMELDSSDIQRAISEIKEFQIEIEKKIEELKEQIGANIAWSASRGFSTAISDDTLRGEKRYSDVTVTVDKQGDMTVVIASGKDAVFIEFGAGVYNNSGIGSSPHPKGGELGFTIGGYGKGLGAKKVWGFYDGDSKVLTHGTPAAMPMYRGMKEACDRIGEIVRGVFGI